MRIFSVLISDDKESIYNRLHKVWEFSCKKYSPCNSIDTLKISEKVMDDKCLFNTNHAKLKYWMDYCVEHNDDDIVLMDCDTVVLNNLQEVFDKEDFDIATTIRNRKEHRINGGVVFIRKNKGLDFLKTWFKYDTKLVLDKDLHSVWRDRFYGMNQASYGYMLSEREFPGLVELPCSIYNRVNWSCDNKEIPYYILHVKSRLREYCLKDIKLENIPSNSLRSYVRLWRKLEKQLCK